MPRAVVDTSVLVSAFLFPHSLPGRLIKLAEEDRFALHLSPILLKELREVLHRERLRKAYGYTHEVAERWCATLLGIGKLLRVPLPEISPTCRDPDDDHVIAAALAAGASWIVTGDKDLLTLGCHADIRMVTPRAFIDDVLGL